MKQPRSSSARIVANWMGAMIQLVVEKWMFWFRGIEVRQITCIVCEVFTNRFLPGISYHEPKPFSQPWSFFIYQLLLACCPLWYSIICPEDTPFPQLWEKPFDHSTRRHSILNSSTSPCSIQRSSISTTVYPEPMALGWGLLRGSSFAILVLVHLIPSLPGIVLLHDHALDCTGSRKSKSLRHRWTCSTMQASSLSPQKRGLPRTLLARARRFR